MAALHQHPAQHAATCQPQRNRPLKRPKLEEWVAEFEKKVAFTAGERGCPPGRQPVRTILKKFEQLKLCRGTHGQLQRNALYACYQARYAANPDQHVAAAERNELREGHKALEGHLIQVNGMLAFLERHASMAKKAVAVGFGRDGNTVLPMGKAGETLQELKQVLLQYRRGLEEIEDFDHPIHITSADFEYRPFEFDIPIHVWHNKTKNLAHVGLMFHLTYLFKYFTSPNLPQRIDARFVDWRLEFNGPMLKGSGGKAHSEIVAPLVNAVFQSRYSPLQVQNRLKDLTIRKKSKGSELRNAAIFIGWELVDEVPNA